MQPACSNDVPNNPGAKVILLQGGYRQPVLRQMPFSAFHILSIHCHRKSVIKTLNQLTVHSKPIPHYQQILTTHYLRVGLFLKLLPEPASKGVAHFVLSTNESVAGTSIASRFLNENSSVTQNDSPDADSNHIA
jgi:hypothetical protein